MKRKKNLSLLTAVFASALAASSLTAIFLTRRFLLTQFQLLESFSQKLLCLSSEYKDPLLASLRLLKADASLSAPSGSGTYGSFDLLSGKAEPGIGSSSSPAPRHFVLAPGK